MTRLGSLLFALCAALALAASPALAQHDHEHAGQGQSSTENGQGDTTQQGQGGMMMRQGQGGMMGPGEGGMMRQGMMRDDKTGPDGSDTADMCRQMSDMMGPGRHGMHHDMRHGMGMHSVPMMEAGLAYIKADIEITEAQASAWEAYASAVRARHTSMQGVHDDMMKATESGSALDRLDARIKATEARLESLKTLKPAVEGLYAVLTDAQKDKANKLLGRRLPHLR